MSESAILKHINAELEDIRESIEAVKESRDPDGKLDYMEGYRDALAEMKRRIRSGKPLIRA